MKVFKFLVLMLVFSVSLFAYNLADNDKYFKDAIAKAKLHNFGRGRVVAVLDIRVKENCQFIYEEEKK